jgi:hypothetical protein
MKTKEEMEAEILYFQKMNPPMHSFSNIDAAMLAKRYLEDKLGITITKPKVGFFHFEDFEPRYDAEKNEITVGDNWIVFIRARKECRKPITDGPKGS